MSLRKLPDHVRACAISPDGKRLAYTGGKNNEVFVAAAADPEKAVALAGTGRRILKVAFAKEEPFYRLAFGSDYRDRGFNDYADLQESFDTTRSSLVHDVPLQASDWLAADWLQGDWRAKPLADGTLQLSDDGVPKGSVVLDPRLEGRPRCYCWIADREGKPFAIAVGTDVQNSIYVCRLAEKGPCPVLRHFRGHHDYVTSLAVSRDLRLLASSSADGTIMIWSLSELSAGSGNAGPLGSGVRGRRQGTDAQDPRSRRPIVPQGLARGGRRRGHPLAGRASRSHGEPAGGNPGNAPHSCPGRRRSSSRSAAAARPGRPSNSSPPGSRWRRCSSRREANGRSGRPKATTTPRSTAIASSAGR